MGHLDTYLAGWEPPPAETTQRLDAAPVTAFAALLDQPAPAAAGDPLPPSGTGSPSWPRPVARSWATTGIPSAAPSSRRYPTAAE